MKVLHAYQHLGARLPEIAAKKDRPRWSVEDIEAVQVLLDLPAREEQIALARIEGIASQNSFPSSWNDISAIARRALGLA